MKNTAIAFSTKDQVELSRQTIVPLLQPDKFDLWWVDGSSTIEGQELPEEYNHGIHVVQGIKGGADSAIAYKLSAMLKHPRYEFVGIAENDVLLQEGWFEKTMTLFDIGKREGLDVGAVSPRSYSDRVLIQRDGYGCMLNIGAGFIIFTREAAEIALRSFRTNWWPDTRQLFAQLSGIDTSLWIGFREQLTTTDWQFEAQLASHGLASLALTPSKAQMPWEDTSISTMLNLTGNSTEQRGMDHKAFETYRDNLQKIRQGIYKPDGPGIIQRFGSGMMFYPHQLGYLAGGPTWQGNLELQNSQAHGPFAYRVGAGGASLSLRISGSCSFLVGGGTNGAQASIRDTRSGFNFDPALPAMQSFAELSVPGGPVPREVTLEMSEGAVFFGVQTTEAQMLDTSFRFDWAQLPEAK